ncbi:1 2-dihydroxy-3-keto-5-methylthiopentene dioxygenase 2 [Bienertia sinuspersici]
MPRTRPHQNLQTRQQIIHGYPQREKTIDSVEAASRYNGVMICEEYAKKPSYFGKGRPYYYKF